MFKKYLCLFLIIMAVSTFSTTVLAETISDTNSEKKLYNKEEIQLKLDDIMINEVNCSEKLYIRNIREGKDEIRKEKIYNRSFHERKYENKVSSMSFKSAVPITIGEEIEDSILVPREVDYFSFTPTQSGYYSIETKGEIDTIGIINVTNNYSVCDDDGGLGGNFRFFEYLEAGVKYILEVSDDNDNETGLYYLIVEKRNTKKISGLISLPEGEVAPSRGIDIEICAVGEYYDYCVTTTIEEGKNLAEYTINVQESDEASEYNIIYYIWDVDIEEYATRAYYNTNGTTNEKSKATPVNVSNQDISGIDLELLPGISISGTISLPEGKVAPSGGIEIKINVNGENEYCTDTDTIINSGQNFATYTLIVPKSQEVKEYKISYWIEVEIEGYIEQGYFSINGTTSERKETTPVEVSNQNINGIDLELITEVLISGTISLPEGKIAPAEGIEIRIYVDGDSDYCTDTIITSGENFASYILTVPELEEVKEYKISYWVNNQIQGYINRGYYNINGTTSNMNEATPVEVSKLDISGIYLELMPGKIISGTISLPEGEEWSAEWMFIKIFAQGDVNYSTIVFFDNGKKSATYELTVPEGIYKINYFLFSDIDGLYLRGYYSIAGTTSESAKATLVEVTNQDITGINLEFIKSVTISGLVSLPAGEVAPEGDINIKIYAENNSSQIPYYMHIEEGKNSSKYIITLPKSNNTYKYNIGYKLFNSMEEYIDYGYYNKSKTVGNRILSTPIYVGNEDINEINITIREDKVVVFPDQNLETAIREALEMPSKDLYISDLETIEKLYATERGISNLEGIQYLVNLNYLELEENLLGNIDQLSNMKNLEELWLGSNRINNIDSLSSLTKLKVLDLHCNQISSITPLANLKSIRTLFLFSNQIKNIDCLENLINVNRLFLNRNQISNIDILDNLIYLESLFLDDNNITNINSINSLTKLEELGLSENNISDIYNLEKLVNLSSLCLNNNQIYDFRPLSNLTNLLFLYLDGNETTNYSPTAYYYNNLIEKDFELTMDGLVSVIIDNNINAKPQSGLNEANVVYETSVAPGLTRFLAVYDVLNTPENTTIGPVRSASEHFVVLASGIGGGFIYAGGSNEAVNLLPQASVINMDEKCWLFRDYFFKDDSRIAPHNIYSTINNLKQGMLDNIEQLIQASDPYLRGDLSNGIDVNTVKVRYEGQSTDVEFKWNETNECFERYENGELSTLKNGEIISADNVVVVYTDYETNYIDYVDETKTIPQVIGNGAAEFYRDGQKWTGEWNKDTMHSNMEFALGDNLMVFDEGNLWLLIIDKSNSVDLPYDFNEDGTINILDLDILSSHYATVDGNSKFDSIYDLNNDGIVNIYDLVILSRQVGQ